MAKTIRWDGQVVARAESPPPPEGTNLRGVMLWLACWHVHTQRLAEAQFAAHLERLDGATEH